MTVVRPLAHIESLHAYTPGVQPSGPGWIKLNTNENPYPPSPRVDEALRAAAGDRLRLYPNPRSEGVRQAVARAHGLTAEQTFVGNGSDEVLALLFRAYCDASHPAGYLVPSYSLYPVLAAIQNAPTRTIELDRAMRLDPAAVAQSPAAAFFLTSPNAPTGVGFATAVLEEIARSYPGLLVIDEAYAAFAAEDAAALVRRHDNVCVVRTLSKSHGMAGVRLGYALAPAPIIEVLDRIRDSYNVNRLSQEAAIAALGDEAYYAAVIQKVKATRDACLAAWAKLGWFSYPSQANFIFTEPTNARGEAGPAVAKSLYDHLFASKILVRYFGSHPLTQSFLRISVGTDEEMRALDAAILAWRESA